MSDSQLIANRIRRTYRQTVCAPPDDVFPQLCPVREAEWLDGWNYTMIYSESGLVERGAVFSTPGDGENDTVWVVTKHDPERHELEFVRFTHKSRACLLGIVVHPKDTDSSYVDIAYTFTAISPAGNWWIEGFTEDAFLEAVTFWEKSMNHFLKTGRKLEKPREHADS